MTICEQLPQSLVQPIIALEELHHALQGPSLESYLQLFIVFSRWQRPGTKCMQAQAFLGLLHFIWFCLFILIKAEQRRWRLIPRFCCAYSDWSDFPGSSPVQHLGLTFLPCGHSNWYQSISTVTYLAKICKDWWMNLITDIVDKHPWSLSPCRGQCISDAQAQQTEQQQLIETQRAQTQQWLDQWWDFCWWLDANTHW